MAYGTRNKAADVSLTATAPLAQRGRWPGQWVRWSRRMKAEFLDALASSCNVKASADAIGVDPASVYSLRRRDPEFLREWGLALDAGYQLLETMLLGHVMAGGGRGDAIDMPGLPGKLDVETALRLLAAHRQSLDGRQKSGGPRPRLCDAAETDAAILKKLSAIEKRRAAA